MCYLTLAMGKKTLIYVAAGHWGAMHSDAFSVVLSSSILNDHRLSVRRVGGATQSRNNLVRFASQWKKKTPKASLCSAPNISSTVTLHMS